MSVTSIPRIYRLGDRNTIGILEGAVLVEEKYDGSQFSFGLVNGQLVCRSKNAEINQADPGMFKQAVDTARGLVEQGTLVEGWTYQCEFIAKPKHNVLTYSRVPMSHLVLFDVRASDGCYYPMEEKHNQARLLGLEIARVFHSGGLPPTQEWLDVFLAADSSLGGCKVEGVVIKNYARTHTEREGHPQTAKVVSEAFKEVKKQDFVVPSKAAQNEKLERVIGPFRTTARWLKAVQHLKEAGKLTDSPKDIGPLLAEVWTDILSEEYAELSSALFKVFDRELRMGATKGFPEWYLSKLQNGFTVFETEEVLKVAQNPGGEANQ